MVNEKKKNSSRKGISIDEKIQILINHGDIRLIERKKGCTEEEMYLVEIKNSLKRAYIDGRLTEEQIKLLEAHGMVWNEKVKGRKSLNVLIEANAEGGETKQGKKDLTEEERKIRKAKHYLRVLYKKGKLSEDIIRQAEANGMIWDKKDRGEKALKDLIRSGLDIGSIRQRGKNLTEEERRLGEIKHYLKRLYREGELSEDIIRQAEEHGMVWNSSKIKGIKALNVLVNSGFNIGKIKTRGKNLTEEERKLGEAKHYLRRLYREGELSEDIIRKAEEHGMVWKERNVKRKTKGKSRLETLKRKKKELDDKEEKAKELLEEVERQEGKERPQQGESVLDGEER